MYKYLVLVIVLSGFFMASCCDCDKEREYKNNTGQSKNISPNPRTVKLLNPNQKQNKLDDRKEKFKNIIYTEDKQSILRKIKTYDESQKKYHKLYLKTQKESYREKAKMFFLLKRKYKSKLDSVNP